MIFKTEVFLDELTNYVTSHINFAKSLQNL